MNKEQETREEFLETKRQYEVRMMKWRIAIGALIGAGGILLGFALDYLFKI